MRLGPAKIVAVAAVISTILMVSVAYYWPIEDAYHPLNSDWNGCTELADHANSLTLVSSYSEPLPQNTTLLAIVGPALNFSGPESSAVRAYIQDGGNVLLADDFGSANSLLQQLGIDARFAGKPLADLHYYSRAPDFPLIGDFASSTITFNITTIVLNHPTYIEVGSGNTVNVLAWSSPFSFIDSTGKGEPFQNETIKSYPIMAATSLGKGMLVMVSDASMFNNQMIDLLDNLRLSQNILAIGDRQLLFDVAHLAKTPLTDLRVNLRYSIQSLGKTIPLLNSWKPFLAIVIAAAIVIGVSLEVMSILRKRHAKSNNHPIY